MGTTRPLSYELDGAGWSRMEPDGAGWSALQRASELHHADGGAAEILMLTGNLGFLHAWFLDGCR